MPDLDLLKSLLERNKLRKQANKFPEHPTEKQYEKDATYDEEGEGKFPIREEAPDNVIKKDIADAKRLEHHVSPEDQAKVNHRIEKIEKEHGWNED